MVVQNYNKYQFDRLLLCLFPEIKGLLKVINQRFFTIVVQDIVGAITLCNLCYCLNFYQRTAILSIQVLFPLIQLTVTARLLSLLR